MKDFKSYFYAITALLMLGTSCTKTDEFENERPATGNIIERPLRYSIAKEIAGDALSEISLDENPDVSFTKAPTDGVDEYVAMNVWIFQFDGADNSSTLVGSPHYVNLVVGPTDPAPVVPLVESDGATHRLVYIVNTNAAQFNWNMTSGVSTYQNLIDKYQQLVSEEPLYGHTDRNLPMSGSEDLTIDNTTVLEPEFIRSVARVELNLSVGTEEGGFTVMSVQLCNIPDRMDWADALLTSHDTPGEIYPFNGGYINYAAITEASKLPVDGGEAVKYQWYMPRNAQGVANNSDPLRKSAYAPASATYFKIIAKDKDNVGVIFRLLPGANMTNDFNLLPNHKYTINLKIVGLGNGEIDSRIENFGKVKFADNSNCYILNPPLDGMAAREFEIPITRVNKYWQSSGDGYGNMGVSSGITGTDTWEVELLWQDLKNLVLLPSNPLSDDATITLTRTTGTGFSDYGTFKISVPAKARFGNFVVACYKTTGGTRSNILWSWHFWVTDYNPYQNVYIKSDQWTYPVPGGQVERYGSPVFGYTNQLTNNSNNNYKDYSPEITATAPYAQSVMMDRFLGALDDQYLPGTARGALFYQYGRKDPIPGSIDLYNINGQLLQIPLWTNKNIATTYAGLESGNNIAYSVKNPLAFISYSSPNWSGYSESNYLWLDSKNDITKKTADDQANKTGYFAKSFYDPCPLGWKLPVAGITTDFRKDVTTLSPSRNLPYAIGSTRGALYWPYVKQGTGYPVGGRIYYPTTGNRNALGTLTNSSIHGKTWTASVSTTTSAYELSLITQTKTPPEVDNIGYSEYADNRNQANTVRCIRE